MTQGVCDLTGREAFDKLLDQKLPLAVTDGLIGRGIALRTHSGVMMPSEYQESLFQARNIWAET